MSDACLIVGAGPVGLTLANLLTHYAVPFRIVDKNPEPVIQTKAAGLWARTLEVMHHLGLSERFLEASHRSYDVHLYAEGEERVHLDLSKVHSTYNFVTLLPQHQTEALLLDALAEHGVEVERGLTLTALEYGRATLSSVADAAETTHTFRYVFGCDGAHSKVRKEMGAEFPGHKHDGVWIVADAIVTGEKLARDEVSLFVSADGPFALFALGHDRYRIVTCVKAVEEGPIPLSLFQDAADRAVPFPVRLSDGQHLTWFSIHERQATIYRSGAAFVLGDAAHIHSPAGGQGLNTGIQDAFNLAWKIAQVYHWGAPDSLLDSFFAERHPVAARVLKGSSMALKAVGATNPIARTVRLAAMNLVGHTEVAQTHLRAAMSETDIQYGTSPLNAKKGSSTLRPGARVPEVHWRDARSQPRRLHDILRALSWTLLSRGKGADLSDIEEGRLARCVITRTGPTELSSLSDPEGKVAEACGLEPGGHLLIRPDGYVAGYFRAGEEAEIRAFWEANVGGIS